MSDPIEDAKQKPSKKVWMKAKGICVVLEKDTLKMDLEPLMDAIRQLKNVHSATFIDDEGMTDHINRIRVRDEYRVKLKELVGLGF